MDRGTTPRLTFTLPIEASALAAAWVTIAQDKKVVVDKELNDCARDGRKLVVELTQEETLSLDCTCLAEIQLRVRTLDGYAFKSQIFTRSVERILKEGVI